LRAATPCPWPCSGMVESVLPAMPSHIPRPSEEGTTQNIERTSTSKPRPESGRDCLACAGLYLLIVDDYVKSLRSSYMGLYPQAVRSTAVAVHDGPGPAPLSPDRHLPDIELWSQSSGSNVIPRRARPGLAGLRPHSPGMLLAPRSRANNTYKTVRTRIWSWLSGKSP